MTILITGGAGFIGSHLVEYLRQRTDQRLICLDNFNDYYDPALKRANAETISQLDNVVVVEGDFCDVEFDPQNREIIDLSERYMSLCIFRKTLFSQYGLFRGYNFLLLLYGVTKWLSRVFALEAGRNKVEAQDLAKAIQLVEQQYVRHNENLALLRVESRAMRFVDRLFSDLGFAPIIVKS